MKEFQGVAGEKEATKAIDAILKMLKDQDLGKAFDLAKYPRTGALSSEINAAFLKANSVDIAELCAKTVENLVNKERPMGEVFAVVASEKIPVSEKLWEAVAQWNETLIKGRIVSSIFKTASQYKAP